MPLSGLSANTDVTYVGQKYSRGRRSPGDTPAAPRRAGSPGAGDDPASGNPFDAAYYASRFKADLSDIQGFEREGAPASDSDGDHLLFDFFGNLSVLLVSVRAGDLERARAAADALELEVMVEHSAGHHAPPGRPNMLDDLRHLLTAAQSGDERAARAAAQDLARDVKQSLDRPHIVAAPEFTKLAEASSALSLDPTAAYDALRAYIDEDTPSAT